MSSVRGWWFPFNSRKAHYFNDDRRSLCGKCMYLGSAPLEDDKHESPQNCVACMKEREALVAGERRTEVLGVQR